MIKTEVLSMAIYITVFAFIGFDILTGLIKALAKDGLNSTILRKGMYHKLSEILTVIGAGLIQYGADYIELGIEFPALVCIASYICIMELVSIIENLAMLNPQLYKLFKPVLNKLKDDKDEKSDDNE
jgi:toxin secretion/phage lysis holin